MMSNSPEVKNLHVTELSSDLPKFRAGMAVRKTKYGIQFLIVNTDDKTVVATATLSGPGTAELINQALEVLANG
jgi:hypothetical protein